MLRDNLVGLIEPMLNSAGAYSLALCTEWKPSSDDRPRCLENPRPEGAESTLTENACSPFHAEPRHTVFAGFSGQDVVALLNPGNSVSYLHHGPDQSVFALTDSNGKLSQAYSYTAFGEPHIWNVSGISADASSSASPFLFQGAFYGADLGLYRMGARTYAPAFGRFLSPDPIGSAGGLNLFAFVEGRPLSLEDPDGTNGRTAETAHSSSSPYASWTSTLTSDYWKDQYHAAVNQAFGPGNGILSRSIGITNMIFISPLAVAQSITNVPGAFIGNIIDQNVLRGQGRYALANSISNDAGERIQGGLFSTAAVYGIGSVLLGGTGGAVGGSSGPYISSSLSGGAPAGAGSTGLADATFSRGPYTIYFVYGEGGRDTVTYIGITKNFDARLIAQYAGAGREISPIFTNVSSIGLARGIEQNLIELYGRAGIDPGGVLTNIRNSISPAATNYQSLTDLGRAYLRLKGWPGY